MIRSREGGRRQEAGGRRRTQILSFYSLFLFSSLSSPSLCASASLRESPPQSPLAFQDSKGRQLTLARPPERIVSLNPGNTEILLAIDAQSLLAGVDQYSARTAPDLPEVGTLLNPSFERIVSLEPDLVLITEMSARHRVRLESLGLKVALIDPYRLEEVYDAIHLLGRLTSRQEEADQMVSDLTARVEKVREAAQSLEKRPRVFVEVWPDPLRTAGPGTFLDELIQLAGGINIASDALSEWPLYSLEKVVQEDPQVILTPIEQSLDELLADRRAQWSSIAAVRQKRVYLIDQDTFSRPGPRLIDVLEQIAGIFREVH